MRLPAISNSSLIFDALISLVQEGVIAPEEALRRAVDQGEFARAAKAKGIDLPVAAEAG